jgi:hypothetical protein
MNNFAFTVYILRYFWNAVSAAVAALARTGMASDDAEDGWVLKDCLKTLSSGHAERTVISGFRRDGDEICALLRYYAASCGNCLLTFRDNISVSSSRVKKSCPETSVNNYHTTPRNIAEECRSHAVHNSN